jgi:cytochrome c553
MMLREMLPHPPDLLRVSERYSTRELFQIVKHGLKLGGMPGWPAQERDDEVWAMVALLQALPALGRDGFVRLSAPRLDLAADVPDVVRTVCARCHGLDGLGPVAGAVPILAGQRAAYLHQTLKAFSLGSRLSGIMSPIAEPLADQDMVAAAGYYSALTGLVPLAVNTVDERAPRCSTCHAQTETANAAYPLIGGQYPNYVALQLTLFAERRRGGTAFAPLMHPPADRLTEEQRWQLAHALSRLR